MEKKYFALGTGEGNKFIRIVRVLFGVVCWFVAVFWLIFNFRSAEADGMLWITIAFLASFGSYQVWAGLGLAARFIEIGPDNLRLKRSSLLQAVDIEAKGIDRIELMPLSIVFRLRSGQKVLLRLGATYIETNEDIKDALTIFAEANTIPLEIVEERI